MTTRQEPPPRAAFATAGVLYLVIIVCGLFAEVGVRGALVVAGDPAATAANIAAREGLFRLGFAADAVVFLSDAALAALLYVLFRPAAPVLAAVAGAFRLAQAAILGLNLLVFYAALPILGGGGDGGGALAAFAPAQRQGLALLALDLHGHGYDLGLLFFAGHCGVLGGLIAATGAAPRLLGWLLCAAGLTYLAGGLARFLAPAWVDAVAPAYAVAVVAEVAFCLWLLARGLRAQPGAR